SGRETPRHDMKITRELPIAFRFNMRHNRRPSDSPATPSADVRFDQKSELDRVRAPVFQLSHSVALGLRFDGRVSRYRLSPIISKIDIWSQPREPDKNSTVRTYSSHSCSNHC